MRDKQDESNFEKIRRHVKTFWRHTLILSHYWKFILGMVLISFGYGYWLHYSYIQKQRTRVVGVAPPPKVQEQPYPNLIPPGSTLSAELKNLGVNAKTIHELVIAARPVINLGRLRSGTQFRLTHLTDPSSELVGIDFKITPVQSIRMKKVNGKWSARAVTQTVESKVVTFSGVLRSTLWDSAEHAGMDTELIIQLAEIFGWQVDFAREVRLGDRWRLSVEQKLVDGQTVGWGSILAAEYQNGKRTYTAVLFKLSEGNEAYYAQDGSSLRRTFLKSPLRYGRITSGFSMHRFHPILKKSRPHLGVDYGAPVGTPVRAVGDGVVTFAAWQGDSGKTLKIKHSGKYQTVYRHLSGYDKSIKVGARVKQGQTVAYVGKTGLATGPHLHFEFWVNGKVIDPLSLNSPAADPVPPGRLAEFTAHAAQALKGLPSWNSAMLAESRPANSSKK